MFFTCIKQRMENIEKVKHRKTRNKLSVYELSQIVSQITKYLENRHSISELVHDNNIAVDEIINPASLAVKLLKKKAIDIYIERKEETIPLSDFIINPYDMEWVEQYYLEQDARLKNIDKDEYKDTYKDTYTNPPAMLEDPYFKPHVRLLTQQQDDEN